MHDVITVGSSTLDVFARAHHSELIKIKDTEMLAFAAGSKILIDDLEFTLGGGGTNTAFAFKRLGVKTAYLGKLGDQIVSKTIERELNKEKIDHICMHGHGKSGYSIILDTLKHDRTILTYKGQNSNLKFKEIPIKKIKAKWFYFCSMVGESYKTLEKLAEFAEKKKIKIAFNPSAYLAEKGPRFLKKILQLTDVLILNKEEAGLIVEKFNMDEILSELRKLGPKIVVVTDGKKGCFVSDGINVYTCLPPKVKIMDCTGAGDAFGSSFVAGIIKKKSIEESIKLGIANSNSIIRYFGAKNGLLSYNSALKYIKKNKIEVKKKKL